LKKKNSNGWQFELETGAIQERGLTGTGNKGQWKHVYLGWEGAAVTTKGSNDKGHKKERGAQKTGHGLLQIQAPKRMSKLLVMRWRARQKQEKAARN